MPQHRQQDRSSEGKGFDFLDDNFNDSSDEDIEVQEGTWKPIILGPSGKRGDYKKVC
jgi:hypothetical protein